MAFICAALLNGFGSASLGLALILSTKKHKTVVIGVMAVLNIAYLILFAWSSPIY